LNSFPVNGETPEDRDARLAKAAAYTQAVGQFKKLWTDSYMRGYHIAVGHIAHTTGLVARDWQRRAALWNHLAKSPPQAACDLSTLQTREQCKAAKTIPLYMLDTDARLEVWMRLFTADIFATFFFHSRNVVDLR
jgi:hypothetical protein